ncbi:MAG TPA: hypothetical protein DCM64_11875 [Gammaproteobacteria bacterium]|jgi:formate dehydrogenase assembly factor FdhD|nr:hypothetical protein [Gammaproteobacteria bacterium]MDP6732422.1 hypothetical protein [Gammaproteobacteria bacterium]HAJ77136.1 hypothetical protein [Gammaproteobacteria bacterium]|tara:strand:- start:446 stop:706 length:261 start_codon:yes stop_codon:yes gene_type:complete
MNTLDLLQALILLGAPMVALSWFVFGWLFNSGEIDRRDDNKSISAQLKKMKKSVAAKEHKIPTMFMTSGCGLVVDSMDWQAYGPSL